MMKQIVTYYNKCLCCGNVKAFVLRDKNTNTSITNSDIHSMISESCKPENRIDVDWCEKCKRHTKQEEVGWDY